jgi:hypothetical protein
MDAPTGDRTLWDIEELALEILANCMLPSLTALAAVDSHWRKLVLAHLQHWVHNIISPFIEEVGE